MATIFFWVDRAMCIRIARAVCDWVRMGMDDAWIGSSFYSSWLGWRWRNGAVIVFTHINL